MVQFSLNWVIGQDLFQVVLVLGLEYEFDDGKAVPIPPCLDLSLWISGLQVSYMISETNADSLIEVILLLLLSIQRLV